MSNSDERRWQQRLDNFGTALAQLTSACERDRYDDLERAGLIKTFEFCFELSWNVLKDLLYYEGHEVKVPRATIRRSFEVDYIDEDDCETLARRTGQTQPVEPHVLERRGSRSRGIDQGALLPGPAETLPDSGRQADAMTDGLKNVHREAIIAEIAANERVERAVLFGSRATGTNTVSSDVDIALFGDRLTLTDLARLAAALDEIPMAQSVDLLLHDSLQDRTLREHIRNQGIEWFARPMTTRSSFASRLFDASGDWSTMPFSDLVFFQEGPGIRNWQYRTEGVPFVNIRCLVNGRLDVDAMNCLDPREVQEKYRHFLLDEGDYVVSSSGTIGRIAEVCREDLPCMLNTSVIRMRPKDNKTLDRRFLRYFLTSSAFQDQIRSLASGSVQVNYGPTHLEQVSILVPPRSEQRSIGHILGTLDDKIELNRRMNVTLEAMARALFRSWFVDFDPVRAKMESRDTGLPKEIADLFPDQLVESELGEMPAGWEVGNVEEEFEIIMGQSPPGHTYNDTGDGLPFFQGRSDFGFRYPKNRKFCTAPKRIAQPWDTIVSVRAPVGDINVAWEQCCIGRGVAALRPRSGAVSYGYCATQVLQTHMREYEHTGTVFGAINRRQLARLPLSQPAPDVVRCFEDLRPPVGPDDTAPHGRGRHPDRAARHAAAEARFRRGASDRTGTGERGR